MSVRPQRRLPERPSLEQLRKQAKEHLDTAIGTERWKWCKVCEREVTQRILNEP